MSGPGVPITATASLTVGPVTWMRSVGAPSTTRTWAPNPLATAALPSRPMVEPVGTETSSTAPSSEPSMADRSAVTVVRSVPLVL